MRKFMFISLLGAFILCLSTQSLATRNTGNPFFKTADGYVTSDFTKSDPLLEPLTAPMPESKPAPAVEPAPQPAPAPVVAEPRSSRYYRYDSRLPDAGKILSGGHVVTP